jgi:MFS transporter, FSR family, fosmidomycin resistance protein
VRKIPICLAVLGHTTVDAIQNILPVVLPLLVDRLQLTYTQVGAAAALLNISSSVIQPAFGCLADRRPLRWLMPAGVAWTALLMGLLGLAPTYGALLVLIGLTGIGTAAFHPVASMTVAQSSGTHRGFGMSLFSAGGNLGFALGPLMAAWLLGRFGLPGTVATLVPGLIMAGGMLVWSREQAISSSVRHAALASTDTIPWGRLGLLCAIITLRSWGYSGLIVFLPLFLRSQGVALTRSSWALFLFLLFGAIGGMLGGHFSDKVGRQMIMAGSLLAYPGAMTGAFLSCGLLRWGLLGLAGMFLMASFSVTVVYAQELLPRRVGLASGLTLGLAFGMGGIGVMVSGLLADGMGMFASICILVILPAIAGLLALFLKDVSADEFEHASLL